MSKKINNTIEKEDDSEVIIKIKDLCKSFETGGQTVEVLKGISMDVREGDFMIIFGPSGCGKSTLLYTILGLEIPTSGSVCYWNMDLYKNTTEDVRTEVRRLHVGMVYQQSNWVSSLNVIENVALPLRMLGEDEEEANVYAKKMLAKVGMEEWATHKPSELSSGQQQKAAVARALVTDPEIIIADEPTGNLDYESGKNLLHLLGDLRFMGKTILMVTHDLEYLQYAKSTVQMLDGRIVAVSNNDEKYDVIKNAPLKKKADFGTRKK